MYFCRISTTYIYDIIEKLWNQESSPIVYYVFMHLYLILIKMDYTKVYT